MTVLCDPAPRSLAAASDAGGRETPSAGETFATNHGAHRLMWWLARAEMFRRLELAEEGVSVGLTDRLLGGEVMPEPDIAIAVARTTEGEVLPEDWDDAPGPAWTSPPASRAKEGN